jgi:phosphoribosyl-ATP pyrophosphohydrolase/phosphoribosyl-AMP cyclohydrolase
MNVQWNADGLVPAIIQNASTAEVLMMAWMNDEALGATRDTGIVHFWSRSRSELWEKGATSSNRLHVVSMALDCDGDTILVNVRPDGPACHTGDRTCFGASATAPEGFADLEFLWSTIGSRARTGPETSYTASLVADGVSATARKVIEEAAEVADALISHERGHQPTRRVTEEAADLLFHLLVALEERSVAPGLIFAELRSRRK